MLRRALTVVALCAAGVACTPDDELPATLIVGPRVLVITAEPPSIAPGEMTTLTAVIAGADAPSVSWLRCRLAPRPGDAINPDCVRTAQAAFLEPIGEGTTITTSMPADVTAADLGQPDATGGVYLPVIARVTVAAGTLEATYRLRLAGAADVNHNPTLTGLFIVAADGTETPVDEASPPTVHAGERLTLRAAIATGSVESYPAALSGDAVAETLRTSWFSTAGRFSQQRSEGTEPATVLQLGETLPAPGDAIDLYAVTRDDRGGADYVHRSLLFGQ